MNEGAKVEGGWDNQSEGQKEEIKRREQEREEMDRKYRATLFGNKSTPAK